MSDPSPYIPRMGAEGGYESDDISVPLRVTGFVSCFLGLLSVLSLLAVALLIVPVVAIFFGLIALRPSRSGRPVGTTPAMLGLLMAVGFGACGLSAATMKQKTMGGQAEYFSRQYLELIAKEDYELALELKKDYVNRFSRQMRLKSYYESNDNSAEALEEFRDDGVNSYVQSVGPDGNWKLAKSVRVFHKYGADRAEVVWVNADDPNSRKIEITMECRTDAANKMAQWHVVRCQYVMKQIVAESVL